ncbi:MAG TPA: FAD-dependent oxidoreductase [Candidatus Lokiarchaeia archaeon]|nr:FAD-dependent oxidoreductase [Candidatus Lokiarchaeia archaeon]
MKEINADVIIAGGGLAGTMAAIAAKRTHAEGHVLLVERYGFLGGMATAGFVFPYMQYQAKLLGGKRKRLIGGLFQEMNERLAQEGFMQDARKPFPARFDPAMMRCVLDEMVLDAGVDILFHGLINHVDTTTEQEKIDVRSVTIQTKAGSILASARYFIDATGDADLVFHAGGEWVMGREEDGLVQPATLNFRIGNISSIAESRGNIRKKTKAEKLAGNALTPRDDCLAFDAGHHQLHFNQTRVHGFDFMDPFDITKAEIEGRAQAKRYIKFLRNKVRGYKHSTVVGLGTQLGIRESRRIVGDHVLTEQDLLDCIQFPDRIALGNYSIDIHDPKGTASTEIKHIPNGKWYSIPYSTLLPRSIGNMIVAGRPISTTHVAHSAIRIMPICSAIGHAAGVAAGLAMKEARPVSFKEIAAEEIQRVLRKQGAVLE